MIRKNTRIKRSHVSVNSIPKTERDICQCNKRKALFAKRFRKEFARKKKYDKMKFHFFFFMKRFFSIALVASLFFRSDFTFEKPADAASVQEDLLSELTKTFSGNHTVESSADISVSWNNTDVIQANIEKIFHSVQTLGNSTLKIIFSLHSIQL